MIGKTNDALEQQEASEKESKRKGMEEEKRQKRMEAMKEVKAPMKTTAEMIELSKDIHALQEDNFRRVIGDLYYAKHSDSKRGYRAITEMTHECANILESIGINLDIKKYLSGRFSDIPMKDVKFSEYYGQDGGQDDGLRFSAESGMLRGGAGSKLSVAEQPAEDAVNVLRQRLDELKQVIQVIENSVPRFLEHQKKEAEDGEKQFEKLAKAKERVENSIQQTPDLNVCPCCEEKVIWNKVDLYYAWRPKGVVFHWCLEQQWESKEKKWAQYLDSKADDEGYYDKIENSFIFSAPSKDDSIGDVKIFRFAQKSRDGWVLCIRIIPNAEDGFDRGWEGHPVLTIPKKAEE